MHHVYVRQQFLGIDIINAVANINFDAAGNIVSAAHNFFTFKIPSSSSSSSSSHAAWLAFESGDNADIPVDPVDAVDAADAADAAYVAAASTFEGLLGKAVLKPTDAVEIALRHLGIATPKSRLSASLTSSLSSDAPFYSIKGVPGAIKDVTASLKFLQGDNGADLHLIWDLVMDLDEQWLHIQVGANSGVVHGLMDWVNKASYTVYPLGTNDPADGPRVKLVNPAHHDASPYGWNSKGKKGHISYTNVTVGNNVYAQENLDGGSQWRANYRPTASDDLTFDFAVDLKKQPSTYLDASIVNLFYWNNILHDLLWVYGFNEPSGNFQEENYGRGGKGGDAVIANAQDGSGYNNANFATPPDGEQPRMRMYVWSASQPYRDGDLEGGIITHEYLHGVSTRLTGGADNVDCLGWGEAGGMGEGWGDYFATILRFTPETTRNDNFNMGGWSANRTAGIRKHIYSTSLKTNPSTYGFTKKPDYWEVHAKGEVWAAILYEVVWNLIDKHGFEPDYFNVNYGKDNNLVGLKGNILAFQLVMDGLKLQPCYPTFVDARDAILLADQIGTRGANQCEIWTAFAKRGLGIGALGGGTEDFELPEECRPEKA
eukprot:jgi/Hompol1/375/HPOL_000233-RA